MSLQFTLDGVTIETFDEIYDSLATQLKAIYGSDINLDQDTPDGQRLGIIAKLVLDGQSFGQLLYSQLDVDFSFGTFQDVICKIAGVYRNPATLSQVDLTVTTDRDLTIEAGYIVEDTNGQRWQTQSNSSLTTGANTVTVFSQDFGPIEAAIGTVTTPITIVLGVISITNPAAATVGVDEETDEDLRIKRNRSLENPAYSTVGAIAAKLFNLSGVTDLQIYENATNTFDATLSLNGHSIWAVIEGGEVADIAEVFAKNKTGGTGLKGSVTGTYIENITKPDGSTLGIPHNYFFDRPSTTELYVRLDATRRNPTQAIDTDLIKQKISQSTFNIADDADASLLYAEGYKAGDNFVLYNLEVSDDNTVWVDTKIDGGFDSKFNINVANVTVTEV